MVDPQLVIEPVYLATVFFFIIGLYRMSNPLTARSGIVWAGAAMLLATVVTFLTPGLGNIGLIGIGTADSLAQWAGAIACWALLRPPRPWLPARREVNP